MRSDPDEASRRGDSSRWDGSGADLKRRADITGAERVAAAANPYKPRSPDGGAETSLESVAPWRSNRSSGSLSVDPVFPEPNRRRRFLCGFLPREELRCSVRASCCVGGRWVWVWVCPLSLVAEVSTAYPVSCAPFVARSSLGFMSTSLTALPPPGRPPSTRGGSGWVGGDCPTRGGLYGSSVVTDGSRCRQLRRRQPSPCTQPQASGVWGTARLRKHVAFSYVQGCHQWRGERTWSGSEHRDGISNAKGTSTSNVCTIATCLTPNLEQLFP